MRSCRHLRIGAVAAAPIPFLSLSVLNAYAKGARLDVGLFVGETIGRVIGSFRDPAIIVFAICCGVLGRSRAHILWPLAISIGLTSLGALLTHFVWQTPATFSQWWGVALVGRFYINCVIGYLAYVFGRILFRAPQNLAIERPQDGST